MSIFTKNSLMYTTTPGYQPCMIDLCQLALTIRPVLVVVSVPVHVVELDGLDAHVVAKAADNHDPAF